jgi:hypothetical protein
VKNLENTQSEEKKTILDKLEKLSRMAASAPTNPHEAAVAAGLMKQLMDEYNIKIDEIKNIEEGKSEVDIEFVDLDYSSSPRMWIRYLSSSCATFFDCKSIRKGGRFSFIGFELDKIACAKLFKYLYEQIDIQADLFVYDNYANEDGRYRMHQKISWSMGVVAALSSRFEIEKKNRQKVETQTSALVILKGNYIDEFIKLNFPKLREASNHNSNIDPITYMHGNEYGKKIDLQLNEKLKE